MWVGSLGWKMPWRRESQPTLVFLPGESHEQRSLAGNSPWGREGLDTTEHTCIFFLLSSQHTVFYSCKQWKQCQTLFWGGSKITVEKEMATHSSVLAWRIPGTGEPGGLQSMGSHRVGHY